MHVVLRRVSSMLDLERQKLSGPSGSNDPLQRSVDYSCMTVSVMCMVIDGTSNLHLFVKAIVGYTGIPSLWPA